jgi:hypothetical protein
MILDNRTVLRTLKSRGVEALYHANSVRTACTFLRAGALLSRGYVEDHGLQQTSQPSDSLDKRYGIWHDVFLDAVDIHYRARNNNHYGPVLFVLDLESVLKDANLDGALRITRVNPVHWQDAQADNKRYFETNEEFGSAFSYGDFGVQFTLRAKKVPLSKHLKHIVLDDPQASFGDDQTYVKAKEALQSAAKEGDIETSIRKRDCRADCRCLGRYKAAQGLKIMFGP